MDILILNGPNLNLLGTREPKIYGTVTMDEVVGALRVKYPEIRIHHCQTNHEGVLIDKLHEFGFSYNGIILNAGGYTHSSIALGDAVSAIATPVVEVHISDIENREAFRKRSYIKDQAIHQVVGEGIAGYEKALKYLMSYTG